MLRLTDLTLLLAQLTGLTPGAQEAVISLATYGHAVGYAPADLAAAAAFYSRWVQQKAK